MVNDRRDACTFAFQDFAMGQRGPHRDTPVGGIRQTTRRQHFSLDQSIDELTGHTKHPRRLRRAQLGFRAHDRHRVAGDERPGGSEERLNKRRRQLNFLSANTNNHSLVGARYQGRDRIHTLVFDDSGSDLGNVMARHASHSDGVRTSGDHRFSKPNTPPSKGQHHD
jgi:hypothetical protein